MHRVLTITLNPAIDITTAVPALVPGRKLRCDTPRIDPGGGGINVSRVIKVLGGASTALVAIAGATGELLRSLLADAGLDTAFLEAAGITRQNFAIHDRSTGDQFRFLFPGSAQTAEFGEQTLAMLEKLLMADAYPYVVASGSLPPGLPDDFYGAVTDVVRRRGSRLILDTSGPALQAALNRGGVFLVKPNLVEAAALAVALGVEATDPEALARSILDSGGAEIVIATHGADGAFFASKGAVLHIRPPHVEVVSPVGAGDSFVGALSFALVEGWPPERACAYGVAAAAAAVTTEATELAHKRDIDRLFRDMDRAAGQHGRTSADEQSAEQDPG